MNEQVAYWFIFFLGTVFGMSLCAIVLILRENRQKFLAEQWEHRQRMGISR